MTPASSNPQATPGGSGRCRSASSGGAGLEDDGVLKNDDLPTIGFPIGDWKHRPRQPGTVIELVEVGEMVMLMGGS